MQDYFSYIPDNYFSSTDEEEKDDKTEEKEAERQKENLIKNVVNVVNAINIIKPKEEKEEIIEEFVPGITIDKYKLFNEYRTNFQNRFFHYLEKDFFDDTKKLINNSFLIIEERTAHLLNYDEIELQQISSNLDSSNYIESYNKVNNILEDLLTNISSLKNLQQERIKPKFEDEEIENRKIDKEIKKLVLKMMKKIKFCEALIKMEKNKNMFNKINNENTIEEKVKNNVRTLLIEKIQDFTNEFRKNQQQFLKYLKEMGNDKEFLINNNDNNINNLNESFSSLDDEKENLNKDFLFTQEDDLQMQIKKRDEDINILANSITELSGIFKDLQSIVQEQGTILDRIDYNIDVSYENSHRGLKSLKKAEEHQNQSCFRNVIMLLFFIIFVETIMIMFKIF